MHGISDEAWGFDGAGMRIVDWYSHVTIAEASGCVALECKIRHQLSLSAHCGHYLINKRPLSHYNQPQTHIRINPLRNHLSSPFTTMQINIKYSTSTPLIVTMTLGRFANSCTDAGENKTVVLWVGAWMRVKHVQSMIEGKTLKANACTTAP